MAQSHQSAFQTEALQTAHDADIRVEDREDMDRQLRLYQGLLDEALADADTPPGALADLHYKVAQMQYYTDHYDSAKHHAQHALLLRTAQQDKRGEADSHRLLGHLALREADLKRARAEYEAALPIYETIGDRLGAANTRQALGDLALREADRETAQRLVTEAMRPPPQNCLQMRVIFGSKLAPRIWHKKPSANVNA